MNESFVPGFDDGTFHVVRYDESSNHLAATDKKASEFLLFCDKSSQADSFIRPAAGSH